MPEGKKKGSSSSKEQPRGSTPPHYRQPPPGYYGPPPGYYGRPPPQEYQKVFRGEYASYNHYPKNENENIFAGLCYLFGWIVALIILLVLKPMSPWMRFHTLQSLTWSIVLAVTMTILVMISFVLMFVLIGFVCIIFVLMISLAARAYSIIMGVLCITGKDHRIPIIADWVEKNFV